MLTTIELLLMKEIELIHHSLIQNWWIKEVITNQTLIIWTITMESQILFKTMSLVNLACKNKPCKVSWLNSDNLPVDLTTTIDMPLNNKSMILSMSLAKNMSTSPKITIKLRILTALWFRKLESKMLGPWELTTNTLLDKHTSRALILMLSKQSVKDLEFKLLKIAKKFNKLRPSLKLSSPLTVCWENQEEVIRFYKALIDKDLMRRLLVSETKELSERVWSHNDLPTLINSFSIKSTFW